MTLATLKSNRVLELIKSMESSGLAELVFHAGETVGGQLASNGGAADLKPEFIESTELHEFLRSLLGEDSYSKYIEASLKPYSAVMNTQEYLNLRRYKRLEIDRVIGVNVFRIHAREVDNKTFIYVILLPDSDYTSMMLKLSRVQEEVDDLGSVSLKLGRGDDNTGWLPISADQFEQIKAILVMGS